MHRTPKKFHADPQRRPGLLPQLEKDALRLANDPREILLCFSCDPYQPNEAYYGDTHAALDLLDTCGLKATVLTKAGMAAAHDFDLLECASFRFGTTIIFTKEHDRVKWEPFAAPLSSRIGALVKAKKEGIRTWVSLEPVIDPAQALDLIDMLHDYVDHWKVGRWNHDPRAEKTHWGTFLQRAMERLEKHGADYYIKDDLAKHADTFKVPAKARAKP